MKVTETNPWSSMDIKLEVGMIFYFSKKNQQFQLSTFCYAPGSFQKGKNLNIAPYGFRVVRLKRKGTRPWN